MIAEGIQILETELKSFLSSLAGNYSVKMENFATKDLPGADQKETIIATLVNIQEESTLKNFPNKNIVGNNVLVANPKVNLNLYVLFISHYADYKKALRGLSYTIQFFQGKSLFLPSNTNLAGINIGDFKISLNIYTPSFEESNYLWSILGGSQYPAVMYKVKLVTEERAAIASKGAVITEMSDNSQIKN